MGRLADLLASDERQQVTVDVIGVRGRHPVRIARVHLQLPVLQQGNPD